MTGLTNNFTNSGGTGSMTFIDAQKKLHATGTKASEKAAEAAGDTQGTKPRYNAISKDGDTVQISQLASSSANQLKQLYSSRKITKQQYDKYMKRFEKTEGENSPEENFDVAKATEATTEAQQ